MREYIRKSVRARLLQLFPPADAETALSWWIAKEGRPPVVIVGAGFTRNAVDRATGKTIASSFVPLWWDILRRFGEDLRVDPFGIDALTIAELHEEGLGRRRHIDLLLEMLPDERLNPGDAHRALFDLRPIAIITTNFLDTVLDRHPRAAPVFDDAGAAVRVDPVQKTEVIYLHGHRSAPTTWVLTRSQYEELEATRPVLVTRVRQLLAQHPVLTVGFGLGDPDFHELHRQMSAQMKRCQPLGLTLDGPTTTGNRDSEHEAAFRRHWERQDVRIARFKDYDDFDTKLARFLRLPGKIDPMEIQQLLRDEKSFLHRTELARSVFHDPNVEERVDGEHGWQEVLWRTCLEADLTETEQQTVKGLIKQVNDVEWAAIQARSHAASAPGLSDGLRTDMRPQSPPGFSTEPLNDLDSIHLTWELARLCDCWWQSNRDKIALLDWLHERIIHSRGDWPIDPGGKGPDVRVAQLLVLLVQAMSEPSKSPPGLAAAGAAMHLLRHYEPPVAQRLETKFPHLRDVGKPNPMDRDNEMLQAMKRGFQSAMNGDHASAARHYGQAIEDAKRLNNAFVLWLAEDGHWISQEAIYWNDHATRRSEDDTRQRKRRRADALEAEHHPKVVKWRQEAQTRLLELRKLTVDDLRAAPQKRAFESRSWRFSSVPHLAWRSLRDLEEAHAHPSRQREYLLPLLDHGLGDIAEEATYRLKLNIDAFDKWSVSTVEDINTDRSTYDQQTESLVLAWFGVAENQPSTSALVGCVQAIPALPPLVHHDHVNRVLQVLQKADEAPSRSNAAESFSETGVHTYGQVLAMGRIRARAWQAWLGMRGEKEDFAVFRAWADRVDTRTLLDPFEGRLSKIHWESLIRAGVPADDLALWLTEEKFVKWLEENDREIFCGSFAIALWQIAAVELSGIASERAWVSIAAALYRLLSRESAEQGGEVYLHKMDDLVRAAIGVLTAWSERGAPALGLAIDPTEIMALREHVAALVRAALTSKTKITNGLAVASLLSVAADVLARNVVPWTEWLPALWGRLAEGWPSVLQFGKSNPFSVDGIATFLAVVVEKNALEHAVDARKKLLEIQRISAASIECLSGILDKRFWGEDTWWTLVHNLRVRVGGARGQSPGSWRTAICSLVRRAVMHERRPLPVELRFLVGQVVDLSAHEDAIVANHAAYAVATIARYGIDGSDDELVREITGALRSIADDPRLCVRAAAAGAAAGLLRTEAPAELKELSLELKRKFEDDPYALIRSEWLLGERQTEAELDAKRAERGSVNTATEPA